MSGQAGPRRPCRLCGRPVRYRTHPATGAEDNRYTYRHRCTHGAWCRAGERLTGRAHANACCSSVERSRRHVDNAVQHDNIDDCPTWYDGCHCGEALQECSRLSEVNADLLEAAKEALVAMTALGNHLNWPDSIFLPDHPVGRTYADAHTALRAVIAKAEADS